MPRSISILILLALILPACATTGGSGTGGGRSDLIAAEDLVALPELTAYAAVLRLRPRWLSTARVVGMTGGAHQTPRVIVDGIPQGDIGILHQYLAQDIEEMRFLSATDATTRYGTGYQGGAIVVRTKR